MKQILLTGGAGGLGRATAEYLAERDCRVFACDIRETEPKNNIVPILMDVSSESSVAAALESVKAETDKLDAVIHLAGLYMMDSFAEITENRLSRILDVNLMGAYRVNRAFLPLIRRGGGRVVITTSELAGQKPLPFTGIYALTKTALECYADSLRLELTLLGVPVIEVRPGAFQTQLTVAPGLELDRLQKSTKLYGDGLARIRPLMERRIGKEKSPETLAKVIYHIVTAKRPRLRYSPNASVTLRLYSVLPRCLQALIMRRLLG